MGFFNRRTAPADPKTTTSTGTTREKHSRRTVMSSNDRRHKRTRSDAAYGDNSLNTRPKFGQWAKQTWPDVLTMIVMGVVGLGVCATYFHGSSLEGILMTGSRSMKPLLLPLEASPSTSPTARSYTRSSHTLCARRSFQSGRLRCWPRLSRLS